MKISVIIVSYNVKYYLEQCLNSLSRALDGIESEIFVFDNASSDESVEYLQPRYSQINIIDCNHNLGFARANNFCIRQCTGDYVLLINPDTFVGENTVKDALLFMDEHPNAGSLGVKMLTSTGGFAMESRRGVPTVMASFYKMTGLCRQFPRSRRFGKYYMSYLPVDEPAQIEIVSGAFCLLRHEALKKIGLLDPDYFMYGEDIDLSYRLLKGGYENWYLPTNILHYKGESTQKTSFRYVHVFYQAMLIFFRKHFGHLSVLISLPVRTAIYFKAFTTLLLMQYRRLRNSVGLLDYRASEPEYLFIGNKTEVEQCMRLARRKGLSGTSYVADENTLPEGHHALPEMLNPHVTTYVVYDTDAFSYETILRIFSSNPMPNVELGTYNRKTRVIITANEVIR